MRTLAELRAGDYVWIETDHPRANGKRRRLSQISAVNKRRLYICVPNAKHSYGKQFGKLYIEDWRYGFDTKTGKAFHYEHDTMIAASDDEVAQELANQQKKKDDEQAEQEKRQREYLVRQAAPDLLEALQTIQRGFADGSIQFTKKRQSDSDPYHPANTLMCTALAKAAGQ